MTRLLALVIGLAISSANVSAEQAMAPGKIVIDASQDGGVWWFPQAKQGFDSTKDRQGKQLADYLTSAGWEVQEIARGEDVTNRLKGADVVIRFGVFGNYRESEVRAYREYVSNGGNVLLLQGFVREGRARTDKIAKEFGIVFSETVRTPTIKRWAKHPLTENLDLLRYRIGSIVTESPKSTIPIAFLDDDQLVMGMIRVAKGRIIFVSTILPLLAVPQPFMDRVLNELASREASMPMVESAALPRLELPVCDAAPLHTCCPSLKARASVMDRQVIRHCVAPRTKKSSCRFRRHVRRR